jgi:hypothetical protein
MRNCLLCTIYYVRMYVAKRKAVVLCMLPVGCLRTPYCPAKNFLMVSFFAICWRHAVVTSYSTLFSVGSLTVDMQMTNESSKFIAGETITLTCSSEPSDNVEFTWNKDGQPLKSTDERIESTIARTKSRSWGGRLIIRNAQTDDAGEYSCTATRGRLSVTSSSAVVQVQG